MHSTRGNSLAWDCTCPETLTVSHLYKVVNSPGQVAHHTALLKIKKYVVQSILYHFVSIV